MYEKTNRQIEKSTEIITFVLVKLLPGFWISMKVIVSYFMYFTTDLRNDAFELPIEMWYENSFAHLVRHL